MIPMPAPTDRPGASPPLRVLVAGATGYIGRRVVAELVERGHRVVSLVRNHTRDPALSGSERRCCSLTEPQSLHRDGIRGERFDAAVSCIASRGGGVRDSWHVEYDANRTLLDAVRDAGAERFVLLSALCVQRPRLAFQHAKLAFEAELRSSGLSWSIVRPTAFFKSIAGQVPRIRAGKPFLMFGPAPGPACKPISERDCAAFVADCLDVPDMQDRILPIGGPGPAVTARERGEMLFELSGRPPRFRHLPLAMFDVAERVLGSAARLLPGLEDKAEFARIGRYYATESMLALNPATGDYDDAATPEYGSDTLRDFYRRSLERGLQDQKLGEHALF